MRIIDEKGRLFHKFNIIDLFVVIMVGIFVVSFVLNLPHIIKGRNKSASEEMYVKVLYLSVPNYVLENKKVLRPGDTFLAGNVTVEKVLKTTPVITTDILDVNSKPVGYLQTRSSSDIIVLLRVKCVKLLGDNYCANVLIKINSILSLSNELYALPGGVILDINKESDAAN